MSEFDMEQLEKAKNLVSKYKKVSTYEHMVLTDYGIEMIEYLIEQADRVQDLKIMLKALGKVNNRYRETLEFYADKDNYTRNFDDKDFYDYLTSVADHDGGEKARDALEGIK